jgi:mandelate racemase
MPDVERVGGVTGFMRTAALAEAWNLPVCSHLFPEINVHLIAAAPTGYYLEHMPWGEPLFNERLELVDGAIKIPQRPGLGFSWDEQVIARYLAV